MDDNLFQSSQELEALSSIYGDDFTLLKPVAAGNNGSVDVRLTFEGDMRLNLIVPPEYPSRGSVSFSLEAPLLRGEARQLIETELSAVLTANPNQLVLYQLIEKARELVCGFDAFAIEKVGEVDNTVSKIQSCDAEVDTPCPEILHGNPFTERKSTFQAHVAKVHSVDEVKAVMRTLLRNRKIAEATHNIMAYRIQRKGESVLISDCDDDGEDQAGGRVLHLLNIRGATNVIVVISRWFGGVLLGPERFKHINNAAGNVLALLASSPAEAVQFWGFEFPC